MARGRLRIYLGAAPGVGKTYAMLGEGHRRAERGTDVVVGLVETHGRATTGQLDRRARGRAAPGRDLPRRHVHRDGRRRGARPGAAGRPGRRARPHQRARLAARQALAGRRGAARRRHRRDHHGEHPAPGVAQRRGRRDHRRPASSETVPDEVVRRADQIELVDMTPEALRRRMAHGNVYAPEKVDAALAQLLPGGQPHRAARAGAAVGGRPGRRGPGALPGRARHRQSWETRERIVVALTGGPEGETLLRRGARIAGRIAGRRADRRARPAQRRPRRTPPPDTLAAAARPGREPRRHLPHRRRRRRRRTALLEFARGVNATQIVIGDVAAPGWQGLVGPGIGRARRRGSGRHRRAHGHPRGGPRAPPSPRAAGALRARPPGRGWALRRARSGAPRRSGWPGPRPPQPVHRRCCSSWP